MQGRRVSGERGKGKGGKKRSQRIRRKESQVRKIEGGKKL